MAPDNFKSLDLKFLIHRECLATTEEVLLQRKYCWKRDFAFHLIRLNKFYKERSSFHIFLSSKKMPANPHLLDGIFFFS